MCAGSYVGQRLNLKFQDRITGNMARRLGRVRGAASVGRADVLGGRNLYRSRIPDATSSQAIRPRWTPARIAEQESASG
jgi:hypothetical protein